MIKDKFLSDKTIDFQLQIGKEIWRTNK